MIPILYDEKAENIICELKDTVKCIVHEVQNSIFELDLEYSIYSNNFNEIELNKIIKAKASDELGEQLFRIYYISNSLNGFIEVKAQHISYDLIDNFIENITCTNSTCEASFNAMLNKCQTPHKFVGYSDITHTSTYNLSRVNAFEAILGTRGSLLDTYGNGAKLKRDNYNLYLNKARGSNNSVKIAYAKNITGYKRELDESELVTCIYPFAKITNEVEEGEGIEETLVLPERFIQSENINKYPHPKILAVDFSSDDVKTIADLRRVSEKYFTDTKKDIPKVNYEVEFIYLYQTSQYDDLNLKELEIVGMGDTVTIEDKRINMNVEAQVIECYYDSLTERYQKIILGNFKNSLSDIFNDDINNSIENGLDNVRKDMYVNFEVLEDKIMSEVSSLEGDVKTNTTLIEQTSSSISSIAKDVQNNTSLINQTASNISSMVKDIESNTSLINQTASNISSKVSKVEYDNNNNKIADSISEVSQKFNSINTRVSKVEGEYVSSSDITQLNNSWTATFKQGYSEGSTQLNSSGIKVFTSDGSSFSRINNEFFSIYYNGENPVNRKAFVGMRSDVPSLMLGYNGINPSSTSFGGTHLTLSHYPEYNNPESNSASYGSIAYKTTTGGSFTSINMYNGGEIAIKPNSQLSISTKTVINGEVRATRAVAGSFRTTETSYTDNVTIGTYGKIDTYKLSATGNCWIGGNLTVVGSVTRTTEQGDTITIDEEQEAQDKLIIDNMLANTEIFEMMLNMVPQKIDLYSSNNMFSGQVSVYASLIRKGIKTIDEVPGLIKGQVEKKINNLEC